ncbi:MAG: hypothetical protein EPN21_19290 [Methylococcaceae bacterium]|nr:MAG: hypothetical protein EPN21_19290 [Methylococcaceae bacterium]
MKYVNGLTAGQADILLCQDLAPAEDAVNGAVTVSLTQNQFDALVSFTFNVGKGAFLGSTLLKLLNQGQYGQVPVQLERWNRSGGQVVQGLVNRTSSGNHIHQEPCPLNRDFCKTVNDRFALLFSLPCLL